MSAEWSSKTARSMHLLVLRHDENKLCIVLYVSLVVFLALLFLLHDRARCQAKQTLEGLLILRHSYVDPRGRTFAEGAKMKRRYSHWEDVLLAKVDVKKIWEDRRVLVFYHPISSEDVMLSSFPVNTSVQSWIQSRSMETSVFLQ